MNCMRCTALLQGQSRCPQCGFSLPSYALGESVGWGEQLDPCPTQVEPMERLADCLEDFRAGLLDVEAVAEELFRFQVSFQEMSQDFREGLDESLYLERLVSPSTAHQHLLKEHFRIGAETVASGLEELWQFLEEEDEDHCQRGLSCLRRGGDHLAEVARLLDQSADRIAAATLHEQH